MKTSELTGDALDWAVTKCEGFDHEVTPGEEWGMWGWATDWAQGGPIIERERINIYATPTGWDACRDTDMLNFSKTRNGPTPLIAAMRCYVAPQLGDNIDIPKELT